MASRPARSSAFGEELRSWRRQRGVSQLRLAELAGTTPRHVSFVETGRSRPGRELVLRIGASLDLPMRARNALLACAGFAPAFPERTFDEAALRPVAASIRGVLDGHDPYPGWVLDVRGRALLANAAARRFFPATLDLDAEAAVDVLFGRWGPAHVENWPEVAWAAADRRRRLAATSADPQLQRISERVHAHLRDVPRPPVSDPGDEPPVLYSRVRLRGETISIFSAVLRFETSRDVTLAELGVELVFPADEAAAHFFRRHAQSED